MSRLELFLCGDFNISMLEDLHVFVVKRQLYDFFIANVDCDDATAGVILS